MNLVLDDVKETMRGLFINTTGVIASVANI